LRGFFFMNKHISEIIKSLAEIPSIKFVGLGGSRGLRLEHPQSDYDIAIYREDGDVVEPAAMYEVLKPYVNLDTLKNYRGFTQAQINGTARFEVFQKTIKDVNNELVNAHKGAFRMVYPKLMPHGTISTQIISHIVHFKVCEDKYGSNKELISRAVPMPDPLKKTLIKYFKSQLNILLIHAGKIKKPLDCQYFIALISYVIHCVNILIFVANDHYPVLEKGGAQYILKNLNNIPDNYEMFVQNAIKHAALAEYQVSIECINLLCSNINELVKF